MWKLKTSAGSWETQQADSKIDTEMQSQEPLKNKTKQRKPSRKMCFTTYQLLTVTGTVWCQHKDKQRNQWDRIESSETDLFRYAHSLYDRDGAVEHRKNRFKTSITHKKY